MALAVYGNKFNGSYQKIPNNYQFLKSSNKIMDI
jgi:hypothetical protein